MAKVDVLAVRDVVQTDPLEERARRWRRWSYWLFAASVVFVLLAIGLAQPLGEAFAVAGLATAGVGGFAGVLCALRALWLAFVHAAVKPMPIALGFVGLVSNGVMFFVGAVGTLLATGDFGRGRQLRKRGKILLAPVSGNARWLADTMQVSAPAGVAKQWRENGRTEHASVAAFSKLSLQLMQLGAPASLIKGAHEDALDEIRHTELCFDLARAIDGEVASPDAFAEAAQPVRHLPRTVALALLAVDSLIDGALHEGVSARVIAQLARRCEEPAIRKVLQQIARDEGRHAAHGWDVVEFCLREGGEPVAAALRGAVERLPHALRSTLAPASHDGSWERWGIPGAELEQAEFAKTRAQVVTTLHRLV